MDNEFNTPEETQRLGSTSSSRSTGSGWDNSDRVYPTDTPGGKQLKELASKKAANVRQKIASYTRDVAQRVDSSREPLADSLHSTAAIVEERGNQVADAARSVAGRLHTGAEYIRSNDLNAIVDDASDSVKRYPVYALGLAAVVGFLIGRLVQRS